MQNEKHGSLEDYLIKGPRFLNTLFFEKAFAVLPAVLSAGLALFLYFIFLAHPINLVTADLGRHIKNGEITFSNPEILASNFYSYTNPDFPVLNHHYASGLIFRFFYEAGGFTLVHWFFILLSLGTFLLFFEMARRKVGFGVASLLAVPLAPLLAERTEIRPEIWSYLFAGAFFFLLVKYREQATHKFPKFLLLIPVLEIFWVNLHVYFLLGPLLIGAFLLESLIAKRENFFPLFATFALSCLTTLINPFGFRAFTEAVTIFRNYGYKLAENQTVPFMLKLTGHPNYYLFIIIFTLLAGLYIALALKKRSEFCLSDFFVAAGMSIMAWMAIRNLTIFAFFALPLSARVISSFGKVSEAVRKKVDAVAPWILTAAIAAVLLFGLPKYFPYWSSFGFGVEEGNSNAADFFKREGLKGPIFNNYDNGGYLIFHLHPEKVFVDNRPEAYPAEFFKNTYIPMQKDPLVWERESARYNLNTIFFSHRDATPWGQKFLVERIGDPAWAPVFADKYSIIFLKRTTENEKVIKRFEIPKSNFMIRR